MKERFEASGQGQLDPNSQARYQSEMKALWTKHDVNPIRAMLWPFAQFPGTYILYIPLYIPAIPFIYPLHPYIPYILLYALYILIYPLFPFIHPLHRPTPSYTISTVSFLILDIVFIAFFWALKDMAVHYPGMATGGYSWFIDLGAADPTYILPIFNSLTFLCMIEIGSDGMPAGQQGIFKNVMRALAVVMVPLTAQMPCGLFVYWGTNNCISIAQTFLVKRPHIKKFLKIPDMPTAANTPNMKVNNPFKSVIEVRIKLACVYMCIHMWTCKSTFC